MKTTVAIDRREPLAFGWCLAAPQIMMAAIGGRPI
jgi:hypothetical protein